MAETITFRPRPGILEALDARPGNRSVLINAALAQYLNVPLDNGEADVPAPEAQRPGADGPKGSGREPRRARQAVPDPPGEPPECPHPKNKVKILGYGKRCEECGTFFK